MFQRLIGGRTKAKPNKQTTHARHQSRSPPPDNAIMSKGTTLLLIDCQNSFHPGGSLAVPGSDGDAERIASLIRRSIVTDDGGGGSGSRIDRIVATMDTHQKHHVAHPTFWVDGETGTRNPDPFTVISSKDVEEGRWLPRPDLKDAEIQVDPAYFKGGRSGDGSTFDLREYCVAYTRALEESGNKFQLCVWPEHCIIGTPGHCIVEDVRDAMGEWENATGRSVEFAPKGQNLLTEMYSVFKAEVPITAETSFNQSLFDSLLKGTDRLFIAGQAMSHCVNHSTRDLVEKWPEKERGKIFVLENCASSVPGFEDAADTFRRDMKAAGVNVCTDTEAEAAL